MRIVLRSTNLLATALILAATAAAPALSAAQAPASDADRESSSAVVTEVAAMPGTANVPARQQPGAQSLSAGGSDRSWLEIYDPDALERWWQRYQETLNHAE